MKIIGISTFKAAIQACITIAATILIACMSMACAY